MYIGMYYGVRNVHVYTSMVRTQFGFSRRFFAKILNVTPRALYLIELGRLPSRRFVTKIRFLHSIAPYYKFARKYIYPVFRFFKKKYTWYVWIYQKKMLPTGQLFLPI